jgi:hypothetical protein
MASWPNGSGPIYFEVDPVATPAELMRSLSTTIGLKSYFGYSMALELNGMEWRIAPSEYILDAVAQAERTIQPSVQFGDDAEAAAVPAKVVTSPPPGNYFVVQILLIKLFRPKS